MMVKFEYIVVALCLGLCVLSSVDSKEKCPYREAVPDDFPCYSKDDVNGWLNDLQDNGCSDSATDEEFEAFYKCFMNYQPNYVEMLNTHVVRTPLQCGAKLLDTSSIKGNPDPKAAIRLYCQNIPSKDEVKVKSNAFQLISCGMYEYIRKFEAKSQDSKQFKCTAS